MDWKGVADAVKARIEELNTNAAEIAKAAGYSATTVGWIVNASKDVYRNKTLARVSEALLWTPDSISRIGRGENPIQVSLESKSLSQDLGTRYERLDPGLQRTVNAMFAALEAEQGIR
jgi:hypothetical protein